MQKWEYKVEYSEWLPIAELASLGSDGWELITIVPTQLRTDLKGYAYYFKRQKD